MVLIVKLYCSQLWSLSLCSHKHQVVTMLNDNIMCCLDQVTLLHMNEQSFFSHEPSYLIQLNVQWYMDVLSTLKVLFMIATKHCSSGCGVYKYKPHTHRGKGL